jgi:hypothetical protein
MTLGEELAHASDGILELLLNTPDIKRRQALREQLTKILDSTARLVEANVRKDTNDYQAAAAGLSAANGAIKEAKEDLKKIGETIKKIAEAVDLVARLATVVT